MRWAGRATGVQVGTAAVGVEPCRDIVHIRPYGAVGLVWNKLAVGQAGLVHLRYSNVSRGDEGASKEGSEASAEMYQQAIRHGMVWPPQAPNTHRFCS